MLRAGASGSLHAAVGEIILMADESASQISAGQAGALPSAELVRGLRELVERNTRHWKRLIVIEMVAVVVAAPLAYLWAVFSLDVAVHLPQWGRVLASGVFLVVVAGLLRWMWRRWREVRLTEDEVALAIERQTPGTSNQLINSLQIAREAGLGGE